MARAISAIWHGFYGSTIGWRYNLRHSGLELIIGSLQNVIVVVLLAVILINFHLRLRRDSWTKDVLFWL
jgi:hypothetical protein